MVTFSLLPQKKSRYYVFFIDDYTRYFYIYLMKHSSEFLSKLNILLLSNVLDVI